MNAPHGPYETERQARAAAHQAVAPEPGWSILRAAGNYELLRLVLAHAGMTTTAYEDRTAAWLTGFEDSAVAVIAGWIARAHAAGKASLPPAERSVTFDLDDDKGDTYVTLAAALEDYAARHRAGEDGPDRLALRADAMREALEAAMDGAE